MSVKNLDDVPNFNTYFSNLEWEFRVFRAQLSLEA